MLLPSSLASHLALGLRSRSRGRASREGMTIKIVDCKSCCMGREYWSRSEKSLLIYDYCSRIHHAYAACTAAIAVRLRLRLTSDTMESAREARFSHWQEVMCISSIAIRDSQQPRDSRNALLVSQGVVEAVDSVRGRLQTKTLFRSSFASCLCHPPPSPPLFLRRPTSGRTTQIPCETRRLRQRGDPLLKSSKSVARMRGDRFTGRATRESVPVSQTESVRHNGCYSSSSASSLASKDKQASSSQESERGGDWERKCDSEVAATEEEIILL